MRDAFSDRPPLDDGALWPLALAATAIAGTLITRCMMPLTAVAVMVAVTMTWRNAVVTLIGAWLVNQAVGFGLLSYPHTAFTLAWGFALLAGGGAAFVTARRVGAGADGIVGTRLATAFLLAFAAYEAVLFVVAALIGGSETFTATAVAQVAFNEIVWLAVLLGLSVVLRRAFPARFPRLPALRLA